MKQGFIAGFVVLMLFMACSTARKLSGNKNLKGNWVLAVFPYQKKTLAEVFGTHVIELQFGDSAIAVSGTTGCNRFTASYTTTGDSVRFSGNRALTRMACPGYDEQLVLDRFDRVNRYRLVESQLDLLQNEEILMIFAKKE